MRKSVSIVIITFVLGLSLLPVAQAATVQTCLNEVVASLETVMGFQNREALHGYQKELSDLTSTQTPTHKLLPQVEQLARDARVEVNAICNEVVRLNEMDPFVAAAYGLSECKALVPSEISQDEQSGIQDLCFKRSQELSDELLESMREYLIRQAVRTSVEPVVQRMRGLNARLSVLISEYGRLVNNFFTLSFRLGDTIIGERD